MRRTTESGLTLLELLVAMALALSVMGTVLGVLLSARQSLVHAREAAQLQESARFLLEYLSEQIRGAGYSGCSSRSPIALGAAATAFFDAPGITGYDYDAGRASFPVEFRAALRAGNDALLVRTGMAISGESPIRGQAVIASTANCTQRALLRWQVGAVPVPVGANLLSLDSAAFYVGSSSTAPGLPALFRERLALNSTTQALYTVAEEIVPGVEYLQFQYGLDSNADGLVDRYSDAHHITQWQEVRSIKVSVRMRSISPVYGQARPIAPLPGRAASAGADRFMHELFSTTAKIRNQP